MTRTIIAAGALAIFAVAQPVSGQDRDEWMKKQAEKEFKEDTQNRIKVLEAKFGKSDQGGGTVEDFMKKFKWLEKLKIGGDFRLRYEEIKQESVKKRERARIRARLGITAEINEEVSFGLRLASGSSDPVSTNETLDSGFSTKEIRLDLAYGKYEPECMDGFSIMGGKMPNPFFMAGKSTLIWDGDVTPEGVAMSYSTELCENSSLFANLAGFVVDERSSTADSNVLGGQVGFTVHGDPGSVTLGASHYAWHKTRGELAFFDSSNGFGNTMTTMVSGTTTTRTYDEAYKINNLFGEASCKVADQPVKAYGEWIKNAALDVSDEDTGYILGIAVGKVKDAGSWMFDWNYRRLQADATIGAFTDSDPGGGGTDQKGHRLSGEVGLGKGWTFAATYFINEIAIASGANTDYNRLQFDVNLKF